MYIRSEKAERGQALLISIFDPATVKPQVAKARQGKVIGVKDNMALVGILSTQLLVSHLRAGPSSGACMPVAGAGESGWSTASGEAALAETTA